MKVGDTVLLKHLKQTGEIVSISKNKIRVNSRGIIVVCLPEQLSEAKSSKKENPQKKHIRGTKQTGALEIDLHGKTVSEANDLVISGVNQAIMAGYGEVWFVHGRGSGALKKETSKILSELDVVRRFKVSEANPGVTIAYLCG